MCERWSCRHGVPRRTRLQHSRASGGWVELQHNAGWSRWGGLLRRNTRVTLPAHKRFVLRRIAGYPSCPTIVAMFAPLVGDATLGHHRCRTRPVGRMSKGHIRGAEVMRLRGGLAGERLRTLSVFPAMAIWQRGAGGTDVCPTRKVARPIPASPLRTSCHMLDSRVRCRRCAVVGEPLHGHVGSHVARQGPSRRMLCRSGVRAPRSEQPRPPTPTSSGGGTSLSATVAMCTAAVAGVASPRSGLLVG